MRTTTPKYRIEASYICFVKKGRKVATFAQDKKMNENQLKDWRSGMNNSMRLGGVNEHLAGLQNHYSKVTLVNQNTGEVVITYNPPVFEVI
jgi:hypothetical protein